MPFIGLQWMSAHPPSGPGVGRPTFPPMPTRVRAALVP